jgi:hypothetical protein
MWRQARYSWTIGEEPMCGVVVNIVQVTKKLVLINWYLVLTFPKVDLLNVNTAIIVTKAEVA